MARVVSSQVPVGATAVPDVIYFLMAILGLTLFTVSVSVAVSLPPTVVAETLPLVLV